jgi:hypothetical protein
MEDSERVPVDLNSSYEANIYGSTKSGLFAGNEAASALYNLQATYGPAAL